MEARAAAPTYLRRGASRVGDVAPAGGPGACPGRSSRRLANRRRSPLPTRRPGSCSATRARPARPSWSSGPRWLRREQAGEPERVADVRASLGAALVLAGRTRSGLAELDRAAQTRPSGAVLGRVLLRRGQIYSSLGRHEEGLLDLRRSLAGLRAAGDTLWQARVLNNRALIHVARGSLARAERDIVEAEGLFEDIGQDLEALYALHNRGIIAFCRGRPPGDLAAPGQRSHPVRRPVGAGARARVPPLPGVPGGRPHRRGGRRGGGRSRATRDPARPACRAAVRRRCRGPRRRRPGGVPGSGPRGAGAVPPTGPHLVGAARRAGHAPQPTGARPGRPRARGQGRRRRRTAGGAAFRRCAGGPAARRPARGRAAAYRRRTHTWRRSPATVDTAPRW